MLELDIPVKSATVKAAIPLASSNITITFFCCTTCQGAFEEKYGKLFLT